MQAYTPKPVEVLLFSKYRSKWFCWKATVLGMTHRYLHTCPMACISLHPETS